MQKNIFLEYFKSLDLVHPCYNPHPNWAEELIDFFNLFSGKLPEGYLVSVFVVNDGSSKGIDSRDIQLLRTKIKRFYYLDLPKNLGKGAALREAIKLTQADLVMYTDADYPYRMENAWEMFDKLHSNEADIVVGVRDEQYYDQLPLARQIFSLSLKVMNYLFFPSLKVKDTQSGLKGFNQKGKKIFLKTQIAAFLFDMEFLVLASKEKDIRVSWIYVQVREGIVFSTMRFKTIIAELFNFTVILVRRIFMK